MSSLTARTAPESLRYKMIRLPNQPGTASEARVIGQSGVSNRIVLTSDAPDANTLFAGREHNVSLLMTVPHHGGVTTLNNIRTLNHGEQNFVFVDMVDNDSFVSTADLQPFESVTNAWVVVGNTFQGTPQTHAETTNPTAPLFGDLDCVAPALSVTQHPPAWLNGLVSRINGFSSMPKNWDTYGSKPIAKQAILKAVSVAKLLAETATGKGVILTRAPFAAPTSSGGVLFEIMNASRELHIEIEGEQLGLYRIFQADAASEEAECEFSVDHSQLPEVLAWIVGQ